MKKIHPEFLFLNNKDDLNDKKYPVNQHQK